MDQISFLPIIEGQKVEHTQATYYTSDLYKKPLTPDHILGATNFWDVERGQIPYPLNRCYGRNILWRNLISNNHKKWT